MGTLNNAIEERRQDAVLYHTFTEQRDVRSKQYVNILQRYYFKFSLSNFLLK